MSQKSNFLDRLRERHPYLIHSLLIVIATVALVYVFLLFLDVFTSHGEQRQVPDVRYLPMEQAIAKLEAAGLKWDVSDSINYNDHLPPGSVIDQDPKAGSYVKSIRTVFLKVNALHDRMVAMPKMVETMSVRTGQAMLTTLGFKDIEVDSIVSPYSGLILQVFADNRPVAAGTMVSVKAHVRLVVGDGSIDDLGPDSILDSHTIDSIEQRTYEEDVRRYTEQQAAEAAARKAAPAAEKDKKPAKPRESEPKK